MDADPREKVLRERAENLLCEDCSHSYMGTSRYRSDCEECILAALRQTAEEERAPFEAVLKAMAEEVQSERDRRVAAQEAITQYWGPLVVKASNAARAEGERAGREAARKEWEEDYLRHNDGHPNEVHPPELSCVVCRVEIREAENRRLS